MGRRDTDITHFALLLPTFEGVEVRFPVPKIVDLHQIKFIDTPQPPGFFHLPDAGLFSVRPDFGGGKKAAFVFCRFQQFTNNAFRGAVHGG